MSNDKTPEQMLQETYDKVNQIWAAFFGVRGTSDRGFLGQFRDHRNSDTEFREDYYRFKRIVIGGFAFLIGSGAISISVIKLLGVF